MEIVTWVLDGELEHRDSTGTDGVIYPGLAQRMSAGSGIRHSEMNASATADVHLVQMWVLPDTERHRARATSSATSTTRSPAAASSPVASGQGHEGAVTIHQRDAVLLVGRLAPGDEVAVPDAPHVHVFVAVGDAAPRRRAARAPATRRGSPTRGRPTLTAGDRRRRGAGLGDGVSRVRVVAVDWSGRRAGERRHLWMAEAADGELVRLEDGRTRDEVVDARSSARAADDPTLVVGFDFSFSLPGVVPRPRRVTATRDELWAAAAVDGERWLARVRTPVLGAAGPPAARPARAPPGRPRRRSRRSAGIRPKSTFQIGGAGSVGTGSVRGWPGPRPPAGRRASRSGRSTRPRAAGRGRDLPACASPARW